MKHRHLLPNEIDLLVDGEAGFGVAPLRAHLAECAECLALYDDARVVVDALEAMPHFAPSSRLADRVMAQVPVFVPAHVAARDSVTRWLPRSSAARVAALAVFSTMAGALSLAMIWLATRGEAVVFLGSVVGDRVSQAVVSAARDAAVAVLGDSVLAALQSTGAVGVALLAGGFLLTAAGTVAGIRRLAMVNGRQG